tara:strand:- start:435 stop:953 length:519 start_codon:yes stop_codon:yes gene_type:complete
MVRKTRKVGAAKLEARSLAARKSVRDYNKHIKAARAAAKRAEKLQEKLDDGEEKLSSKLLKMRNLCDNKISQIERKEQARFKKISDKIKLEETRESAELASAEAKKPGYDTEELALNPNYERSEARVKKLTRSTRAPINDSPGILFGDMSRGQSVGGKKTKKNRKLKKFKFF